MQRGRAAAAGVAAEAGSSCARRDAFFAAGRGIQPSSVSGAGDRKLVVWATAGLAIATATKSADAMRFAMRFMARIPQRIMFEVDCSIWSAADITLAFIS